MHPAKINNIIKLIMINILLIFNFISCGLVKSLVDKINEVEKFAESQSLKLRKSLEKKQNKKKLQNNLNKKS